MQAGDDRSVTQLGCIPYAFQGDYGGYFRPCHGSHYDLIVWLDLDVAQRPPPVQRALV